MLYYVGTLYLVSQFRERSAIFYLDNICKLYMNTNNFSAYSIFYGVAYMLKKYAVKVTSSFKFLIMTLQLRVYFATVDSNMQDA